MSGQIDTFFDGFDDFRRRMVPDLIEETAVEHFRESFQKEAWEGQPWAPLSPRYAGSKKRSSTRILTRTAALQSSIRPGEKNPSLVRISAGGGKVNYARVHNTGFTGRQFVRSHVKPNFMGKGKPVKVKAHSKNVYIPKRQFMGNAATLRVRISNRIETAFKSS